MAYNTSPYYPTTTGGINFAPSNYQTAIPLTQQPQTQQVTPGLMTIMISSEEEMRNYPVAAGTTVLLIAFNLEKLWLKTTDTGGVPQPVREFKITETIRPNTATGSVTREEFTSLTEKVNKLIDELGGTK